MPDFAVRTAFIASDRISPAFRRMATTADYFGMRAERALMRARRATRNLIASSRRYIGMGLGIAAGLIVREFVQFDQALTSASAKFDRAGLSAQQLNDRMNRMRAVTRQVGATTEFTATQAAQGLEFLAMAGFTANQALALLPGVTNLATASGLDFARASDIASDALGAFGLMTTDTAQLATNFTRINDVMARTVTSTNTNMEDLFETMRYAGPAFTTAGQSIETFSAIAGRMAANSIKGSQAGTALRAGILRLAAPPRAAAAALSQLGIRVADQSGRMRNMIDIMQDIQTATSRLTQRQKLAALSAIFGTRAFSAWAAILNEGVGQTRGLETSLRGAGGASAQMAAVMRTSVLNRLRVLWSTVVELGMAFLDAFAQDGPSAIDSIASALRFLTPIFKFLGKAIAIVLRFLPALIIGFTTFKILMFAFGNVPIIFVITAIVMAIVMMIRHWDAFKNAIISIWTSVKNFISSAADAIGNKLRNLGQIILTVLVMPVNLWVSAIVRLLQVAARIPGVGRQFQRAAAAVQEYQAAANQFLGTRNFFAPNQAQQGGRVNVQGEININNAPPGTTARARTTGGVGMIGLSVMGVNP